MSDEHSISEVVTELRELLGNATLNLVTGLVDAPGMTLGDINAILARLPALLDALEGQPSPVGKGLERPSGRAEPSDEHHTWLPIETAPKDGTRVLLCGDPERYGNPHWIDWWDAAHECWFTCRYSGLPPTLAGWMPLLAPPKAAAVAGEEQVRAQASHKSNSRMERMEDALRKILWAQHTGDEMMVVEIARRALDEEKAGG